MKPEDETLTEADRELLAEVSRALPPEDWSGADDAELEALLDAAEPPLRGRWFWVRAAAAAVMVLGAVLWLSRGSDKVRPVAAGEGDRDGGGEVAPPPEPEPTPQHPAPAPGSGRPPALPPAPPPPPPTEFAEFSPEFPKPMFVGTPVRAERPNLDTAPKPVLAFRAPVGTELLSLDAGVSSSDPAPIIGDLDMVADGDKDGADGSYLELGPGRQWVQIDLGESVEIWAVWLWHFHKSAVAYDDVLVQLSDDPAFAGGVTTVLNNDHDNSSGMGVGDDLAWVETNHGRPVLTKGRRARYVRLYSNGNTANEMNHYVEVEVWGRRGGE